MAGNPRKAALAALEKYRREGAWSTRRWAPSWKKRARPARRALASSLFYGVLQNLRYLDFCIDSFSSVKTVKMEPKVRDILRLALTR
jgi:16S rRNA (cytosine967-C5)-methyltransferase